MKFFFILFMVFMTATGVASAQDTAADSLLAKADSLYDHFYEAKALELYTSILNRHPDHYTALWRASFLYSRIGFRLDSKERQQAYYQKGIALAGHALNVDSTDTHSHFVMAAALGRKAMISGAKERVKAAHSIKHHAERAIRLDSTNAGAWHVLGRLHFRLANLSFVEQLAANTLYGGLPESDEATAVRSVEKAIELEPERLLYYYDLARMYKHLGKEQQAISACEDALRRDPLSPADPGWLDQCQKMIKDFQ
ncbi:hypothetical protein [Halalkalibaculum sp. DA384]|uniref:hypothetical protein n=1 Tax=Halalkalibaculum sp. DA384 TaxID=3373606 RepID=UPI003754A584